MKKTVGFLFFVIVMLSVASLQAQNTPSQISDEQELVGNRKEMSGHKQQFYDAISNGEVQNILLNGTSEDLKNLLDKKINVNIDYGCSTLLNKAIQSLVANQNPATAPEDALEKVKMLIDAGADVNLATCGLTPLATLTGIPDFARKMEKTYIDMIMSNIDYSLDMCHVNGVPKICKDTTPSEREQMKVEIHKIFQEEIMKIEPYYIKIAEILLEHGADINKKSNGIAPLHFAANVPNNEKPILLKYLLEKGADVNIRDFQGSTPLFVANFADNKEVIDLLIKFGADTAIRNDKGILYKDFKTGELYDYSY